MAPAFSQTKKEIENTPNTIEIIKKKGFSFNTPIVPRPSMKINANEDVVITEISGAGIKSEYLFSEKFKAFIIKLKGFL